MSSYERWRKKLKADKVAYEDYKRKDALKQKVYRCSMTESKRQKYNEKAKLRMQKYRERLKKEGCISKEKLSTRKQIEKKQEYWRRKKQEQQQKMTCQQKDESNRKRREHYHSGKKRLEFETPSAKLRVAEKRINLPKKPEMFAATIHSALNNTMPCKKEACRKRGLVFSPKSCDKHRTNVKIVTLFKTNLEELRKTQSKRERQTYYQLVQALVGKTTLEAKMRKELDIKWNYWMEISAPEIDSFKRSDSMPCETKQANDRFYVNESVPLPTKDTVKKLVYRKEFSLKLFSKHMLDMSKKIL